MYAYNSALKEGAKCLGWPSVTIEPQRGLPTQTQPATARRCTQNSNDTACSQFGPSTPFGPCGGRDCREEVRAWPHRLDAAPCASAKHGDLPHLRAELRPTAGLAAPPQGLTVMPLSYWRRVSGSRSTS